MWNQVLLVPLVKFQVSVTRSIRQGWKNPGNWLQAGSVNLCNVKYSPGPAVPALPWSLLEPPLSGSALTTHTESASAPWHTCQWLCARLLWTTLGLVFNYIIKTMEFDTQNAFIIIKKFSAFVYCFGVEPMLPSITLPLSSYISATLRKLRLIFVPASVALWELPREFEGVA